VARKNADETVSFLLIIEFSFEIYQRSFCQSAANIHFIKFRRLIHFSNLKLVTFDGQSLQINNCDKRLKPA
jgi:hypothetical protein